MSSKPGFWRTCRFAFRCARFTIWAIVLLLLGIYAWLDMVGLPNFAKTRLVAALHERGADLEFSRMRWRIIHGLICDNVRIGAAEDADGPVLTAREVQVRLSFLALLRFRVEVDALVLHDGKFSLPFSPTESLSLTNLESDLRFEPDDKWALDELRADLSGVRFTLGGEVAHAPDFRNWKLFAGAKTQDRGSAQSTLRSISEQLKRIHFTGQPQLDARLNGDARDVHSVTLGVNVHAPAMRTPWFNGRDLLFTARVTAPTNAPAAIDPAWGFWTNIQPFRLDWTARAAHLTVAKLSAEALDCSGVWAAPGLAVTNLSARLGGGDLKATARLDVASRNLEFLANSSFDPHVIASLLTDQAAARLDEISWTDSPRIQADCTLVLPPWTELQPDWRARVAPTVWLGGAVAFTNMTLARGVTVDSVRSHFNYSNQVWTLPDLELRQGRTALELGVEENDATRDFHGVLGGKLSAESLRPFLTDSNAVHGFDDLYFRQPVDLIVEARGNLRDLSTLTATGRVVATDFAIRGQWIDSLKTTFSYTNLTAEFFHPDLSRASGAEHFAADGLTLDLAGQRLFLHHGLGRVSPTAVGEAIGPKTALAMQPYQFLGIPDTAVDGCIPLKHVGDDLITDDADLRVVITKPAPFQWLRFKTPAIAGTIHWLGNDLILTNVVADCYQGTARGWAVFNLQTPGDGTDFSFFVTGTDVDFNAMGRGLWSPTNQLRGSLSGNVNVTRANSSDWRTWNGYGQLQLRDGLLWNAPVLGVMSTVINTLAPGLDMGNSRATDGSGRFAMTNGVIYTDSLVISSLTMRIQYVGTVDLQENISARAKAQLLRNTPVIGSFFSMVLSPVSKAAECQVSGTLDQPKIVPIYFPFRVLTAPLHPIRTMEDMFSPPD
jgi:hypothetical protein